MGVNRNLEDDKSRMGDRRSAERGQTRRKRRKKYRLKPQARRLYRGILVGLSALVVLILLLRFTVFKSTYAIQGYDGAAPFAISEQVLEAVKPQNPNDFITMDITFRVDAQAKVNKMNMEFIQLISDKKYREWTLEVDGTRAKLKKGDVLKGNYSQQRGRFPPLSETAASLSRIPLTELAAKETLVEKQYLEFSTKNYRPNVNPAFSDKVEEGVQVLWISAAGAQSTVQANFKPVSNYIAVDCGMSSEGGDGSMAKRYVILLETNAIT